MKRAITLGLLSLIVAAPARAEIPDALLDRDYQSCLGGDTADKDRAAYCLCVRDGMRNWDLTAYLAAAEQEAAAANAGAAAAQTPGPIENLAKQCIAQVLR